MNITALSIRRPSLVIVAFAVLAFMGIASYMRLPIELVPKFSAPVVTIITIYPGASPSEVENAVSKPIEDAISSLEGIDQVQIGSQESSSFVAVEFEQTVDLDKAVQEVKDKLLPSKNLLAPGTFESHLEPAMDYVAGLYLATRPDASQSEKVFLTKEQAIAAYKAGEISARTPIRILGNKK